MNTAALRETLMKPPGELPDPLGLCAIERPFDVSIRPPGSKSITNRVLLLAALSRGQSVLRNVPRGADDVEVMIGALRTLGATIAEDAREPGTLTVTGTSGRFKGNVALDLHTAGTAARFITAAACLADGPVTIDGSARMRKRPMGELLNMLFAVGVTTDELGEPGCLPIRVHPTPPIGGELRIGRTQSSQFVSALAMLGPFMQKGITLWFQPGITSGSYIDMTLSVMGHWPGLMVGGGVRNGIALIRPGTPDGQAWTIEPDASGASYFWAAAAITGSAARVPGLSLSDARRSAQGDAEFARLLSHAGAAFSDDSLSLMVRAGHSLHGGEFDLSDMPDTAMTLAAAACFARGTTIIRGLRTLRVKETDRVAAVVSELSKVGVKVEPFQYDGASGLPDEAIRVTPPTGGVDCSPTAPRVEFETYRDHRMAMSLAIIALRRPNVWIKDPRCVEKTYPAFWRDWGGLYR